MVGVCPRSQTIFGLVRRMRSDAARNSTEMELYLQLQLAQISTSLLEILKDKAIANIEIEALKRQIGSLNG